MCSDSIDHNEQNRLIRSLLQDDPLPESAVVVLMRLARRPDVDYANVAESLVPGAFDYLRDFDAQALARSDTTVDHAKREISKQKAFFGRLARLLPEFLRYYKFNQDSSILSAISVIDDCHHDFTYIKKAPRRDKARRFALQSMRDAMRSLDQAVSGLKAVHFNVNLDYERLRSAHLGAERIRASGMYDISNLIYEMEMCCAAVELCALRADTENEYLILSGSGTSMHIVEEAFTLSQWFNGPPLITTPGSNFSITCSILNEIAGGRPDESLAGAINRFARSEGRRRIQHEEDQIKAEDAEGFVPDNFRAVDAEIAHATEDQQTYSKLAALPSLSQMARVLANGMVRDAETRIDAARTRYGPNLVWAHQIPEGTTRERWDLMENAQQAIKEATIALGELRRSIPDDG